MNRKAQLLLLLLLAFLASGLQATDSRMTALGYPYGFIRDNSDVTMYPATIFQYNRNVRGELYAPDYYPSRDYDAGNWTLNANLPLKKNVAGIYLNFPTGVDVDDYLYYDSSSKDTGLDISRKIQFYMGLAEKFAVGFGMAIDSEKTTNTYSDWEEEMSARYFELSGGMSSGNLDLGAAAYLAGASAENNNDYDNALTDAAFSHIGFRLHGRYFVMESGNLDLAAAANLMYRGGNSETNYNDSDEFKATYTEDESFSDFIADAGVGLTYKPGANHKVVFTVKPIRFASESWKDTNSENDYSETWNYSLVYVPEYTLGVESQITKWLTGRMGAIQQYVFYKQTYEENLDNKADESQEWSQYQNTFDLNLGLGFHFGKFTIDTVLSKSFLHDGPNFLGGRDNGLATQVSVDFQY